VISKINEILDKIPVTMILVCYFFYLGYEVYDFTHSSTSELALAKSEIENLKREREKLDKKRIAVLEFEKNVEKRKQDLLQSVSELKSLKDALPEMLDLPFLMDVLVTEAKRLRVNVKNITPVPEVRREYYIEQVLKIEVSGVYFQLLAFVERLTSIKQIIHVDLIDFKPDTELSLKGVLLSTKMEVKFFKYLGTQADQLGKQDSPSQQVPGGISGTQDVNQPTQTNTVTSNSPQFPGGGVPAAAAVQAVSGSQGGERR
jgi:hypothetical protein